VIFTEIGWFAAITVTDALPTAPNGSVAVAVISPSPTPTLSPFSGSTLTISPAASGPDLTDISQTLALTFVDRGGLPLAGVDLSVTVSGPNATTATATTDASGAALASYTLGGTELLEQTRAGAASYYLHDGQGNIRGKPIVRGQSLIRTVTAQLESCKVTLVPAPINISMVISSSTP
jgi:hypothetical protein